MNESKATYDEALLRQMRSRFDYAAKRLAEEMRSAGEDLVRAARQMEAFDLDEAIASKRMTTPINGLGVLQSRGPMIDNKCGAVDELYQVIRSIEDLKNV